MAVFIKRFQDHPTERYCLSQYHKYWIIYRQLKNPKFDDFSNAVLRFKEGKDWAVEQFRREIDSIVARGVVVVTVPSHDARAAATSAGSVLLAKALAANGRIDGTNCLRRHTTISKLANGGDRSIGVTCPHFLVHID